MDRIRITDKLGGKVCVPSVGTCFFFPELHGLQMGFATKESLDGNWRDIKE
jgi:hypothetical protein